MGIKNNFTKALRELAGEKEADSLPAEELEKVVEAYGAQRVREIAHNVEELEKAVDAYGAQRMREATQIVDAAPLSEASFRGGDAPPSTFAKLLNQNADAAPINTKPAAQTNAGVSGTDASPVNTKPVAQMSAEMPVNADVSPVITKPAAQTNAGISAGAGGSGASNTNTDVERPASNFAQPAAFSGFRQRSDSDDANELTIITKNTIIDGNIRSFADLSVDGDIKGNVETTKNIELNGKVIGNISCNNAFMHKSQVQGNIHIKGNLNMKRDTLLIGDLMSTHAEINGKIKGNIDVAGKAELRSDAVIFGDINASTITVEDGAVLQGRVNTMSLSKDGSKNLFPETIVIGE